VVLGWWAWGRRTEVPPEQRAAEVAATTAMPPAVAPITVAPQLPPTPDSATVGADRLATADSVVAVEPEITAAPQVVNPVTAMGQSPVTFTRTGAATTDTYINLRRDADRTAAIVGTISPGTRVETGARFRGWRQVRTPSGQVGWVDPRHLIDAGSQPR
jgi:uncharacterized protein YgiM (DUF1202 family)